MTLSNDLRSLTDDELLARTREIARREQDLTLQVIAHLEEVGRRRLFAARGYSSLFEYCVKALAYSEPAASQRVAAMRLTREVPGARERLERGELKLSNAAAVERFIRREEKETGRRLTLEAKSGIVAEVSGKSARETERVLAARSEAVGMLPRAERARPLTTEHTELKFVADAGLMARIERARELKGAYLTLSEIFARALDAYLDREDPLRQRRGRGKGGAGALSRAVSEVPTAPRARAAKDTRDARGAAGAAGAVPPTGARGAAGAIAATDVRGAAGAVPVPNPPRSLPTSEVRRGTSRGRYLPASVRREVARRAGGRCEYQDAKTGRRCESRFRLQWDHIRPFAHGGPATTANIRQLCPAHQQWAAIRNLGPGVMGRYLPLSGRAGEHSHPSE